MKKNLFITSLFLLAIAGNSLAQQTDVARYVDPYIGTGGHGHVFLGAHLPFGAVQIGPTNLSKDWDWCSGYHYSDSVLTGFSQLHLSGTGIGDLGDVLIMPYTGKLKVTPETIKDPMKGYATLYSHKDEIVQPGYYSINLRAYTVKAEMTASERVAFHKYTFPQSDESHIALDLIQGIAGDRAVKASIQKIDATTYTGSRFSSGWANDQRVYFAIKLSQPAESFQLYNNGIAVTGNQLEAEKVSAIFNFKTKSNEAILLKVGISAVSEKNALENITAEIPQWNFEQITARAYEAWNKELGSVVVKSKNIHDLRTFYTALYHSFTAPALFNDHNGDYLGVDKKVHTNPGFQNYSVLSLWDTYRAAHPLYTLVQPGRVTDMIKTMLTMYQQQGKLPIWSLVGNETDCMVGYSAVPVIGDAIFKGFQGIDANLAFEAMKASSMRDDYGMKYVKERGYIPADKERESVSKALEYAISDWCIAQLAQKLGKQSEFTYYSERAKAYRKYFDPETKFLRPRMSDGFFKKPFNPTKVEGDYTEGNAWQYAWLVPQDVEGLIQLLGGEEIFLKRLDSLFLVKEELGADAPVDMSGLIGQYVHGNEPSHHITYLYAYAGQQWKTAEKVHEILRNFYNDGPDGLIGNEDCGQMSAWYVLSSIGFYPVNPAGGSFIFGSPLFDDVTINLPKGKKFNLKVVNPGEKNIYIQSVKLNGKAYTQSYITYKEIMSGGKLEFTLSDKPNKRFGFEAKDRPVDSKINIAQNPIITHLYTADPSAHVWKDGRLYVYASHDIAPPRGCDLMDKYHVFSTDDMIHWKDHGEILNASQVSWGRPEGGFMWAPDCMYRNGTYYFYYPHPSGEWQTTWKIGVATSKKPASDFTDQGYIPGVGGFAMIDPCVFLDDDNQAYLYYGGGAKCQGGKLKDNMMEIDGEMVDMKGLSDFHEATWVFKRKGIYYLTYADNNSGQNQLRYAISKNPLGPWEYKGIYLTPTGCDTSHGSVVNFKGQWYAFYHNVFLSNQGNLRSVCVDKLYFNQDGTIKIVVQTGNSIKRD